MAGAAHNAMSLGGRDTVSPLLDDGFIHVDGETHVLNYDTNILNLDDNREITPGADMDGDLEIPTTNTDSLEEDADIEVNLISYPRILCARILKLREAINEDDDEVELNFFIRK